MANIFVPVEWPQLSPVGTVTRPPPLDDGPKRRPVRVVLRLTDPSDYLFLFPRRGPTGPRHVIKCNLKTNGIGILLETADPRRRSSVVKTFRLAAFPVREPNHGSRLILESHFSVDLSPFLFEKKLPPSSFVARLLNGTVRVTTYLSPDPSAPSWWWGRGNTPL